MSEKEFQLETEYGHDAAMEALDEGYLVREVGVDGYIQKSEDGTYVDEDGLEVSLSLGGLYVLVETEEVEAEEFEESQDDHEMTHEEAREFMGEAPKRRGYLPDETVKKMVSLFDLGYSQGQIAEKFNMSTATVGKYIREYKSKNEQ